LAWPDSLSAEPDSPALSCPRNRGHSKDPGTAGPVNRGWPERATGVSRARLRAVRRPNAGRHRRRSEQRRRGMEPLAAARRRSGSHPQPELGDSFGAPALGAVCARPPPERSHGIACGCSSAPGGVPAPDAKGVHPWPEPDRGERWFSCKSRRGGVYAHYARVMIEVVYPTRSFGPPASGTRRFRVPLWHDG